MAGTADQMTLRSRGVMRRLRRLASRFSPDSLLARLILIFSASFFALLFLTSIYAGESRHFYFMRALMADRTRRMAETALLLDASTPETRFVLREQLNSRGFVVHFSVVRPLVVVQNEELREVSELMEFMLNRSLSQVYDSALRLRQGRNGERVQFGGQRVASLAVSQLNLPSPMEAFWKSVRQYFVSQPKRSSGPSVYQATAVIPLRDGTWV